MSDGAGNSDREVIGYAGFELEPAGAERYRIPLSHSCTQVILEHEHLAGDRSSNP